MPKLSRPQNDLLARMWASQENERALETEGYIAHGPEIRVMQGTMDTKKNEKNRTDDYEAQAQEGARARSQAIRESTKRMMKAHDDTLWELAK